MDIRKINFDDKNIIEYFLNNFEILSFEDMIKLLGEKYEKLLLPKVKDYTLKEEDLDMVCKLSYPDSEKPLKKILLAKLPKYNHLALAGLDIKEIEEIKMMDEYKEKVKNKSITENDLKNLCEIVFKEDKNICNIVYNSLLPIIENYRIEEYNNYREQVNRHYNEDRDNQTILFSTLKIIPSECPKCSCSLYKSVNGIKEIITEATFDFNESFDKNFFNKFIAEFPLRNPVGGIDIKEEGTNANVQVRALNNTVFILENVPISFALSVKEIMKESKPVIYQEQLLENDKKVNL